ncbi:MAG: holo-[acyl-carrier-protein] synthase [Chloroflexi bacterium RBG_16_48_8]|nr:MAG: holo-[acyl-carrier-protein] synthase [Chloroflexi bacterium RBG_16_48_8]
MLFTGIDIIEVDRIDQAILRHGQRFFDRFFTPRELIDASGRTPALAARFAVKEAVAKALGTGIGKVSWKNIEVRLNDDGKPELHLHDEARLKADELGIESWSISISHTHFHAVAVAIASGPKINLT